jgi:ArsR family transcriptional regulator
MYVGGAMSQTHFENAKIFKAFCDETRLMVLEFLQNGEKCACVLLEKVKVGQSTLSHHMKILVESGIVDARKEGKWTYYSISGEGSEKAVRLLKEITTVTVTEDENDNERCYE